MFPLFFFFSLAFGRTDQSKRGVRALSGTERPDTSRVTMSLKTRENVQCLWKLVVFVIIGAFILVSGSRLNEDGDESLGLYLRLGSQFWSIDETYGKMVQSFPKAYAILCAMNAAGGIVFNLSEACARVWAVESMPLLDVIKFDMYSYFTSTAGVEYLYV
jgi:hypothetical protein